MKKVLIAIDYHPVSEEVANAGHELAKQMDAEVCLLHVMTSVGYYGMDYPMFMGYEGYSGLNVDLSVTGELRKVAEEYVKTAAEHLNDPKVGTALVEGTTATAILDYSKEWNADLIVMGTHSHSVLEKLFIGTVASEVLEKTEVPVYLVPVKK